MELSGTVPFSAISKPFSAQFRVTPDACAVFGGGPGKVRNLYDESGASRKNAGNRVELAPNTKHRIRLALPEEAKFVEIVLSQANLSMPVSGSQQNYL